MLCFGNRLVKIWLVMHLCCSLACKVTWFWPMIWMYRCFYMVKIYVDSVILHHHRHCLAYRLNSNIYWRRFDSSVKLSTVISSSSSAGSSSSVIYWLRGMILRCDDGFVAVRRRVISISIRWCLPGRFGTTASDFYLRFVPLCRCLCLVVAGCYCSAADSGWPLVWKTWKCRGIWNMSGKCQGCC